MMRIYLTRLLILHLRNILINNTKCASNISSIVFIDAYLTNKKGRHVAKESNQNNDY